MSIVTRYRNGVPNWVDVSSSDIDRAVEFYTDFFGWTVHDTGPEGGGYQMFMLGDQYVGGIGPQEDDQSPPLWGTYLAVDDIDVTLAKVESAGGTIMMARMDVFTSGSMAFAIDPSGAVVGLWQAGDHIGCGRVNEPGTVVWNELATRDAPAATAFYREVFGVEFSPMDDGVPEGYLMMSVGARVVAGVMPMDGDVWGDLPSHWMTYFAVSDTDEAVARAVELGGTVPVEPTDLPVGRFAILNDPTGAAFSIIAMTGDVDEVPDGIA